MSKKISLLIIFCLPVFLFSFSMPEMVRIPAGSFIMGDNNLDLPMKIDDNGIPQETFMEHKVKLQSYNISKTEITVSQYYDFLKETGYITEGERYSLKFNWASNFRDIFNNELYKDYPITKITFEDALAYCSWLSYKTGKRYRLPTEAEWEYAALAGKNNYFPWGDTYEQLDLSHYNEWWIDANFESDIFPVNKFKKDCSPLNVFGTYGNAAEMCLDSYIPDFYNHSSSINPLSIKRDYLIEYSVRGQIGYSMEKGYSLKRRMAHRYTDFYDTLGFRIVEEIKPTVFNKSTEEECTFFYTAAKIKSDKAIAHINPNMDAKELFTIEKTGNVQIYFRSNKKSNINGVEDYWYCVTKENINLEELPNGWVFGGDLLIKE